MNSAFKDFLLELERSKVLENKRMHSMIENVLSMRQIGNKTHGDLAEVALAEYVNHLVKDYSAKHTGKEKFRAKEAEEDITVQKAGSNEVTLISIKAYGNGPLQLSTDKKSNMFSYLKKKIGKKTITDKKIIKDVFKEKSFADFNENNILSLIYDEKEMFYKILTFDLAKAYRSVAKIEFIGGSKKGRRKHPIYRFYDSNNGYIFEVRYGATNANALQRGLWTHTKNADSYFDKILEGAYKINQNTVKLIPKILNLHDDEIKKILKSIPV